MATTLEKLKYLEDYLTDDANQADPVLDSTINKLLDREINREMQVKEKLVAQCVQFEKRYGMTSDVFYEDFQNGKLGDMMDFMEWASTVEMIQTSEKRLRKLGANG